MEENLDEQLLLSQRVDLNSEQAVFSQVLRIAVYDEFKAYETYTRIIEKFGIKPDLIIVDPFFTNAEWEYDAFLKKLMKSNRDKTSSAGAELD